MSNTQLSVNGRKAALICGVALFLGVLFLDWLLLVLSVTGFGYLVYMRYSLGRDLDRLGALVIITPGSLESSFTAGEKYTVELAVDSKYQGVFKLVFPYGELDNDTVFLGVRSTIYSFQPSLAANYGFDEVEARLVSEYGFFESTASLPFKVTFNVYPRVISAALDALSYLEGRGIQGAGEQISALKGRGYEYADSREYVPGDSLKMVNWKASARLNKLIVKEYFMESTWAIHILYENMVSDPVSSDVLSACFLRTVQSFAEMSWVIGLTIIEKGAVSSHTVQLHPDRAVTSALQLVLMNDVQAFQQLYEVLAPAYRPRLDLVMDGKRDEGRYKMDIIKEELFRSAYGGLLYITSLIDDPVNLLEVSYSARLSGTRMVALEPCRPWLYTSLEEAYRIWQRYDKLNRSLARSGVGVAVSLEEAQDKMGERVQAVWV